MCVFGALGDFVMAAFEDGFVDEVFTHCCLVVLVSVEVEVCYVDGSDGYTIWREYMQDGERI